MKIASRFTSTIGGANFTAVSATGRKILGKIKNLDCNKDDVSPIADLQVARKKP